MRNLLFLVPPEFAVLLVMGAGIAMVMGARALAGSLLLAMLAIVLLPVLVAPLFDLLPVWLLVPLLVFFGFGVVRALFELAIGKSSTNHMVGILAADVVRYTVLAPFRLLGWVIRMLTRN